MVCFNGMVEFQTYCYAIVSRQSSLQKQISFNASLPEMGGSCPEKHSAGNSALCKTGSAPSSNVPSFRNSC